MSQPDHVDSAKTPIWIVYAIEGVALVSLFSVVALVAVLVFGAAFALAADQQQFIIWGAMPIAAGMATACSYWVRKTTGSFGLFVCSLIAWIPNLVVLVLGGIVSH